MQIDRRAFALATAALLTPLSAHADTEADAVAALAARADVRAAFAAIEAQRAQANAQLVELVQIPAPPFGEERRAARFAEMLRDAGIGDVSIDEVGNVVGRRRGRGRGPTLAIIAHLDTVFPAETDLRVRVEGDTYHAPGIGDNTRGLVFLLVLARAMNAASLNTRGDLLFVASVGEEGLGDLRGVKHLFREGGPRIDAALIIDGGEPGRIVNTAVGSIRYRVTVRGPGGHSWSAFGLGNPHHALGRIIWHFDTAAAALVAASSARDTYNIGTIGGGTSVNSIPFESWMEVDMRSSDMAALSALDGALRAAASAGLAEENAARTDGPELTLELEQVGLRPAGSIAPDTPFVQLVAAALSHFGVTPQFEELSTDANVAIARGIPAVAVSRGGASGGAHSLDEWWRDEDSHVAVQAGLLIALVQVGLAR